MDGELHVRAAGRDADRARGRERRLAELLVERVGQRLLRRDRPRVAGVDAHRVEVLDRADDDRVAARVAHHLELVLLPAGEVLLDEHLADRARGEAVRDRGAQLLGRPRDAAAGAAERERRPDDRRHREVDVGRVRDDAPRRRDPDAVHRRAEELAILGAVDRLEVGADQLDAEARRELDGEVERGLAAERRQDRVGPLALDHLGDRLGVERLEVGRVGPLGVGHDRRRVRVHEHDAVALAPQHPAGLGAGVVELARLADADRPGAEDQDRAKVGALRHASASRSKKGRASSGPGDASGWNCTLSKPSPASPSQVPSFSETCEMSPSAITAKPWFWTVTSTRPVCDVADRMVRAAMAERELEGLVAEREPEQLVAEADAEERHPAEQVADRLDLLGEDGRVAGAVRDQHDARVGLEDRVGVPGARDDVGLEPRVGEPARDRALRAEVDDDDPRARRRPRTAPGADLPVERAAVDERLGERAGVELLDRRVAERAAQDAAVADPAHERPRVEAGQRDDALLAQPRGELGPRVAHHDALALHAVGLHPRLVDAVGADQRIGEAEHLRDVARVGDRLLVARHRGREAGLAGGDAGGADPDAREDGAVLEDEMPTVLVHRFHRMCIIRTSWRPSRSSAPPGYTGQETLDRVLLPSGARAGRARLGLARRTARARARPAAERRRCPMFTRTSRRPRAAPS